VNVYQRVCGVIPAEMGGGGDMAIDAEDDFAYFRVGKVEAAKNLAKGTNWKKILGLGKWVLGLRV
jgi:oligogalacturonide lyase